jgi:P-type Ca2+ transporter type 2C
MTLIGIMGIKDLLCESVCNAIAKCHKASVTMKMCTGDNVLTMHFIIIQCGIYMLGSIIMEGGPCFQKARPHSSLEDKKILIKSLKDLGEIFGITGDGTNDGPTFKMANVGFSMGITGTEVVKEASDIILMDDNFSSIVKVIMWGRCIIAIFKRVDYCGNSQKNVHQNDLIYLS